MSDRPYYSQRAGRGPATAALGLADLKRLFKSHYEQLEQEGYFQEDLGFECVDSGFNPGRLGTDLQAEILLSLRKPSLWPIHMTIDAWSEDDLFDMLEFLFDHISKVVVQVLDDGAIRFMQPDGECLDTASRAIGDWRALQVVHELAGIHIDERTAATKWDGGPMDYGIAMDGLMYLRRNVSAET